MDFLYLISYIWISPQTYCSPFCFSHIWFISLRHPSSPPLSGYDAHPSGDRPKSTKAIYYTLCTHTCIHKVQLVNMSQQSTLYIHVDVKKMSRIWKNAPPRKYYISKFLKGKSQFFLHFEINSSHHPPARGFGKRPEFPPEFFGPLPFCRDLL